MAVAAIQTVLALRLEADQVIVGIALNLLALGGTRFLLQLLFTRVRTRRRRRRTATRSSTNPLVWLAVIAAVARAARGSSHALGAAPARGGRSSRRAASPSASSPRARGSRRRSSAARSPVRAARSSRSSVGGFFADMSSGRGYIALAMVILGGWRPAYAALACVGVGVAEAINIQLQVTGVRDPARARAAVAIRAHALVLVVRGKPSAAAGVARQALTASRRGLRPLLGASCPALVECILGQSRSHGRSSEDVAIHSVTSAYRCAWPSSVVQNPFWIPDDHI